MFGRSKDIKPYLTKNQKQIRLKLLYYLYISHASHIGPSFSVIDLLDAIYFVKKRNEKFVLSNGHTAAALYIILEKYGYLKHSNLSRLHIHPDRDFKYGIDVSTGSLGQGLPIAVGMALSDRNKNVYCLISDGECAEGSMWESFRLIHDLHIHNLKIILSANGWGAYDRIFLKDLHQRLQGFGFHIMNIDGHNMSKIIQALKTKHIKPTLFFAKTSSEQLSFLKGLEAHYHIMNESDYNAGTKELL